MKAKFQTRASRAEEQVLAMLKSEKNIQKPWSLVSSQIENRPLQTTAAEAAIIFKNHASIRPGYEISNNVVFIPNLFIKLSGSDSAFEPFYDKDTLKKQERSFVYNSFEDFPLVKNQDDTFTPYLKDGQIDKDLFLSSSIFKYTFLRREYQEILIQKANEILKTKQDYFIGKGTELSDSSILSCLFQMDETFMHAFHNFDFQLQPPSVIVFNKGKEKPGINLVLNLILLSLLGFDIVIASPEGHADIENVLNPDIYCSFVGEKIQAARPDKKLRKLSIIPAVIILVAAMLFAGIMIVKRIMAEDSVVTESQATLSPNASPDLEQTTTPVNEPEVTGEELTYSPPPVEEYEPVKPLGSGEKLTFKDPALEKGVRIILGKETGDIFVNELSNQGSIRFIGPYAGGKDWYFCSGYSPTEYYDTNNQSHREEGDIEDLSDLGGIPNVYTIEANWQKEINMDSLKGFQTSDLRLKHSNIEDISALATLSNLSNLDLSYNYIQDIAPLASLPLTYLSIDFNSVSDITPLMNLKYLYSLSLCSNPVSDTAPLGKLVNLTSLYLLDVPINDFSFLKPLTKLENLNIERSGMSDVSLLKDHTRLTFLVLARNDVTDISPLKDMKRLQHLDISMTLVQDLSVLKELPSLRTINLFGMKFDEKNEAILNELKNVDIRR